MPKIAIIMGSKSDLETVKQTAEILENFKTSYEIKVLSAHRTPKELAAYVGTLENKGIKVVIAAAGGSAALAGVIASHTTLPVIGIPIETKSLKGLDSLLSTAQMPPGIPVACMSIGSWGAKNAAIFSLEILALEDKKIKAKLNAYKKQMAKAIKKIKVKI
ncbi:MAG: 5-(carboxyamino)imidazole ribonucleotide mutase [Candidatus Omnitrophica bacterium]|nr:5-(carboxyamino)imidazole ribonucleotide mutase [Candidatus Omnitrophota bacterium]MDD5352906.1 5-(carboxyamino)imidazole ribonucleotide mutase [Candidatus Omnitrophota bacterium]MDD5550505.1 5-(carboxyamino)imidazole ribonucleotide mutase [Candidatus Omnitrophota bacterium]